MPYLENEKHSGPVTERLSGAEPGPHYKRMTQIQRWIEVNLVNQVGGKCFLEIQSLME